MNSSSIYINPFQKTVLCFYALIHISVERIFTVREQSYPISLVFQNIDPPSPSPPGECVVYPSAFVGGEDTLARRRGGWGVNILEDERDRIALLQ
jgi:hypothetical protein